jgi:hypothetical protein
LASGWGGWLRSRLSSILLHRFRIVPAERSVAMNLQPRITLWPSRGIRVKFFRHDAL